jgi:PAS domain S-box-containing protein
MNVMTSPSGTAPPLSDSERRGLRDFWSVYERHYDEIRDRLMADLASHSEIGALMRSVTAEQREEDDRRSRELSRRAVLEGEWEPFLENLRAQGPLYAEGGLSFRTWFNILGAFRPLVYRHLLAEYGSDPDRLLGSFQGMDTYIDLILSVVGEEYLAAKQRVISSQEGIVRRASTSRAVLTSLAEGVVTTDPEGRITALNPAMEHMLDVREQEAIGELPDGIYPLVDRKGRPIEPEERLLSRAIASRAVLRGHGFGLSILTADGRRLPVAITSAPILDERGELLGGVDVLRDVSHEYEVDQMKSSLISTVSHELRTPLTMIRGFAELLLERDLPRDKAALAQEQIRDSADRLSRLIDDLLSVSKIDSGKLEVRIEAVDLHDTVREALASFEQARPVHLEVADRPTLVMADRDKVLQIVTNLVSNAVKYSPEGTSVTVRLEPGDGTVETSVIDRGHGIREEDVRRVFDKFYRVDRPEVDEAKGTGLGLYITKSLVEIQGGDIRVMSRPGEGTTFTFGLPAAGPAREAGS